MGRYILVSGEKYPLITEYSLKGNIIRRKELKSLEVSKIMPYLGYRVPFPKQHKKDAKIKSIAVDSKGNIYLKLFQKLSPYRIDSQGKPKPILPDASIENDFK